MLQYVACKPEATGAILSTQDLLYVGPTTQEAAVLGSRGITKASLLCALTGKSYVLGLSRPPVTHQVQSNQHSLCYPEPPSAEPGDATLSQLPYLQFTLLSCLEHGQIV